MTNSSGFNDQWQTTRWSLVLGAQDGDDRSAHWQQSLESLAGQYWFPAYAYLRKKGYAAEDAQDLTQDFFASLIEKDFLKVVDPKRGRFRWFLMHALSRFAASWHAAQKTQKRGGDRRIISLDIDSGETRYSIEPVENMTPESLFEKQWALTLLQSAFDSLKHQYTDDGKSRLFEALSPFISPTSNNPPYSEVAEKLKLTDSAVKVGIHRLRQKFKREVQKQVLETIDGADQLDEEIESLMAALAR